MSKPKLGVITIPEELKNSSIKLKFCYLALRNLLYYVNKGLRTYTKNNRQKSQSISNQLFTTYLTCCRENESLSEDEIDILVNIANKPNTMVIPSNEYILITEKELGFKNFAFYCDCMVELSFHIDKEYFNDNYIIDTIKEFSEKSMVAINDIFLNFILLDIKQIIKQI